MGRSCPAAKTGLEGCSTSSHPGNLFRKGFLLVGSSLWVWGISGSSRDGITEAAYSMATASSMAESAGAGRTLTGIISSNWVIGGASGGPHHQTQCHQRRKHSITSFPAAPKCSLPKGGVGPQWVDWLFPPKTGGSRCRLLFSPTRTL